ncbi:MAG: helix-turn-helix domain-containing protein [Lewinella sp.]|nr:helix-turn-helix domain-containing protein [Lewinella sp.]
MQKTSTLGAKRFGLADRLGERQYPNHLGQYILPLAFALFFCWTFSAPAQDFQVRHFTQKDGLAGPRINTLLQDRRGFLWLGTGNGLQCYDGYSFRTYQHKPGSDRSLRDNYIRTIYEDKAGDLWVGTDSGLHAFDWARESFTFIPYSESTGELPDYSITAICEDGQGNLWLGTYSGLFRLDRENKQVLPVLDEAGQNCPAILSEECILEDPGGGIWLGTSRGLYYFGSDKKSYKKIANTTDPTKAFQNNLIQALYLDDQSSLWVGTRFGLFLFDREKKYFTPYAYGSGPNTLQAITNIRTASSGTLLVGTFGQGLFIFERTEGSPPGRIKPVALPALRLEAFFPDDHGNYWVGTYADGLFQLSPGSPLEQFQPPGQPGSGSAGRRVCSFFERGDGSVLVGIDGGGVQLFNPATGSFVAFPQAEALAAGRAYSAIEDRQGNVWVATMGSGVHRYDPGDPENSYRYFELPLHAEMVHEDQRGAIWMVGREALCSYLPDRDTIIYYQNDHLVDGPLANTTPWCIYEDRKQQIWLGTENGLFYLDREQDTFFPIDGIEASEMVCQVIAEDHQGRLWTGGKNGFHVVDPQQKRLLKSWDHSKGFPEQIVHGIVTDTQGFLWFGTNNGLYRFDPIEESFLKFDRGADAAIESYNNRAALHSRNGTLYFGHQNGFVRIQPDHIKNNEHLPPVVITHFKLAYRDVPLAGTPEDTLAQVSPLQRQIAATDELRLRYWQNDFSFEFAALDFIDSEKNRYRYKLEPYHKNWVETSADQRQAVFTNLSPGNYRFRVIGSNNQGQWNTEGDFVDIRIFPPWSATIWAYLLYALAAVGLLLLFYRFQLKRQLAAAEAGRLRELDAFKTRLYTNITHEFRTPLTVILGMAERLDKDALKKQKRSLSMIKRNGRQLLRLVNQMLDLRKVESGHMPLHLIQADVVDYLQYLCSSLHSFAEIKGISPHFRSDRTAFITDFDPDKLKMIITNLFSNAIKFTPAGGEIFLEVGFSSKVAEILEIRVRDTGIGIPVDQQPYVFDRFYQLNDSLGRAGQGTGIGLTLTRELVHLLGGTIKVESEQGTGSSFTVCLPVTHDAPIGRSSLLSENLDWQLLPVIPEAIDLESDTGNSNKSLALLIEDNSDVVRYLIACLKADYRIIYAHNGREGIEKAVERIPDIIISDVMMPEKDGYEVCDTLKNDERTSHIPIILLTARADALSRIKGLQKGADAYLAKPFNEQELQVRLQKLIELRRKLRERYQNLRNLPTTNDPVFIKEDAFLQKLRGIIEKHLDDPNYSPPALAREIGLSHSQLFRKIKSLSGKSIAGYIRLVRLQRAEDLLKDSSLNVSEVAYQVGFSNPAYFSRSFQKEFGITPSACRDKAKTS